LRLEIKQMAEMIWSIPADDLPMPAAFLDAANSIIEINAAWRAMASLADTLPSMSLVDDIGVDAETWEQLAALLDTSRSVGSAGGEIDIPNLGLGRWARAIATTVESRTLLMIMPLRSAPPGNIAPVAQQMIEDAYQYLSEGVVILDRDFRATMSTGFISNLLGRPGFANEGLSVFDEIHPDDLDAALASLATILRRPGDQASAEVRIATAQGGYRWFEAIGTNLLEHPFVQGILVMLRDIEARKTTENLLAYRASHDHLTELPNRARLTEDLERALVAQRTSTGTLAVIFFDLDNLKDVNDSLGHYAGDQLLLEAAGRLTAGIRPCDTVYRLGGDEFVILATDLADDDAAVELAESIREAVTGRANIDGVEVFVSSSVGVATAQPHTSDDIKRTTAMGLLRDADSAMYRAKRRGRARVELFTGELHERAEARLRLTGALERAIENDELHLAYQIVVSMGDQSIVGTEALLRWSHPEFGAMSAAVFVEIAEQSGLIGRLGAWVLRTAVVTAAPWYEAYGVRISVNIAPRQLTDPGFVDLVISTLAEVGLPTSALTLEITERTLVEGSEMAACLDELRGLGVGISIDDFGTGYSALAYLRRFAADELKLDAGFVQDLVSAPHGVAVTQAIIEMAHALGMTVTAEGVSDVRQLDALSALGCDKAQGYYLGYPAPASDIASVLIHQAEQRSPVKAS
jgi:diguanylate cyclase (GGDEF)-like protein/PAS domain S-box-containing protein